MVEVINAVLILFVLASAVAAVFVTELISAVFILGGYSFFIAILWGLLNAADVSFTEAVVGAGASTIFMILALFQTSHHTKKPLLNFRPRSAMALTGILAAMFIWGSVDLPRFGDLASVPSVYLSPFYLLNTLTHADTPNAVTTVVTDYRGFDTLIETAVIFTAGIACLLIMRKKI